MFICHARWPLAIPFVLFVCWANSCESGKFDEDLDGTVSRIREESHYPAVAGSLISSESIEIWVEGIRKVGSDETVAVTDRFHIGSNAKAFTATVVGRLVERGAMSWTTRPFDVLPDTALMHAAYRNVTVHHLLTHRSGIQAFTDGAEFEEVPAFTGSPGQQRSDFARWLLQREPPASLGTFVYSNAGYAVAGAMLEAVTGSDYESLIQQEIAGPLGIDVHYGWPVLSDTAQPWGHWMIGGDLVPHDPSNGYVLPAYLVPAGDMNMTIGDYSSFIQLHLRSLRGAPQLLTQDTFDFLHEPVGSYACGWGVGEINGKRALEHEGSAGTFIAHTLLLPARDRAAVFFINAVDGHTEDAWFEFVFELGFLRR